jgi:hypothetical protein
MSVLSLAPQFTSNTSLNAPRRPVPSFYPPPFASSSSWRDNIPARHLSSSLILQDKNTTSLACPNSSLLAVGSSASQNNLLIIDLEERSSVSSFTCPDPVFSLDVSIDSLVTGGPKGVVQLFTLDCSVLDQKGKGISLCIDI